MTHIQRILFLLEILNPHILCFNETLLKDTEDIAEKIEFFLQWTYANTDLARTSPSDKALSYLIVLYQRAGFSEDQLKDLLAKETEYLKVKTQPAP